MNKIVYKYFLHHKSIIDDKEISHKIIDYCKILKKNLSSKKNIFICGNGGSAANAMHIASDLSTLSLLNGFSLNAYSLNDNISVITCISNDKDFKYIFSEQLKVKAKKKDILILLSGSGNSANIIEAAKTAKKIGMYIIGIIGYPNSKVLKDCDFCINLKINDMEIAEDMQLIIHHISKKYLLIKS